MCDIMPEPSDVEKRIQEIKDKVTDLYTQFRAAEYDLSAAVTIKAYLKQWTENVHDNLPFLDETRSAGLIPHEKGVGYVVAFGPSVRNDETVEKLRGKKIISVNKSYAFLVKHGIYPEWLIALEGTEDPYFVLDEIVPPEDQKPKVVMPICVHPHFRRWATKYAKEYYWFVPKISDEEAPGLSKTWTETFQIVEGSHLNNVGGLAYKVAIYPIMCDPIYLVGFDLSEVPSRDWDYNNATRFRYYFNQGTGEFYAMNSVFEDYYELIAWNYKNARQQYGIQTYNLTPRGPIPHRGDIPTRDW